MPATAARQAADEVAQSAPAGKPDCPAGNVYIDWDAEGTDCDVNPPQVLVRVLGPLLENADRDMVALTLECENQGGDFRELAGSGIVCYGIDY